MPGVKGRSGGPRKNAGGKRPGAGRPPSKKKVRPAPKSANSKRVMTDMEGQPHGGALKRTRQQVVAQPDVDMLELLQNIALGKTEANSLQVRAAIAAVQYTHPKMGEGGKKKGKQDAAGQIGSGTGRFASTSPPPPRGRMN
jgi:hypothetical protein